MSRAEFTQGAEIDRDELLVGGPFKTDTVTLTDNQAQGALSRGAVLGMHTDETYGRVHQTGNYGAATARAILLEDADPSGGDVQALVLTQGDVSEDELNVGGTVTVADVKEPLRARDLRVKNPVAK